MILTLQRKIEVLFLKQPLILPLLCHKSATMSQSNSYEVLNSKIKPDLQNYAISEMIETTAPPQRPYKQGTFFWDTMYIILTISFEDE